MPLHTEDIDKIMGSIRELFPVEEEKRIVKTLIEKWSNRGEGIHTYVNKIPEKVKYPFPMVIGIIASDWPGFSDAVMGAVHERGWNIYYEVGMVAEIQDKEVGIIIVVIKIDDEESMKKFLDERDEILQNIRYISIGSVAKRLLISMEAKRLEIYSKVVDVIERSVEKKILPHLIGPDGEVFKFFASRSKAYIEERKPEDLADQIIHNYKIIQRVKRSRGEIQVWVKNIRTTKEHLTGITVGFFEKDLSLKEVLDAISFATGGMDIRYNKEFTTSDGITVVRLEITDQEGNPFGRAIHDRIRKVLYRLYRKRKIERDRFRDYFGGFEHFMRAIIPFLVQEFNRTGIKQVFLNVMSSTEFYIDFKILMVLPEGEDTKGLIEEIGKHPYLFILAIHPPKKFGNTVVNIIDVRAESAGFDNTSKMYDALKEIISRHIGKFRDFDEGMRKMDIMKIDTISKMLKEVPPDLVKKLYYSIEDFYRLSETEEHLAKLIRLGYTAMVESRDKIPTVLYENVSNGTLLALVFPKDIPVLRKTIELSGQYELTFSRLEMPGHYLMLIKLSKDGNPLDEKELEDLKSHLIE